MSEIKLITTSAQAAAAIRKKIDVREIPQTMGELYGELAQFLRSHGVQIIGPPFAYYHSWSDESVDLECGFPVNGKFSDEGRVHNFVLPAVKAVMATHLGPYSTLMDTYTKMAEWMRAQGHEPAGYMWESYLNEPGKVPDAELMTACFWPIK